MEIFYAPKNFMIIFFRSRAECGEACKQRKQLLENECKQLRRELSATDDMKKSAEQQNRTYEQEVMNSFPCKVFLILTQVLFLFC